MRTRRGRSYKATDRHPAKKLKYERNRAKLKVPEVNVCRNSSSISKTELANKIPEVNECPPNSPLLQMMLQSDGKVIPKLRDEPQVNQADLCPESSAPSANDCSPKAKKELPFLPHVQNVEEEEEEEREEESCGTGCSDDSEMEPEEPQGCLLEPDNSAFLNEDSNQPLPVERFFGSVAFLQDLPAAPVRAPASRREFRKLHFIAKDDDEDEDDEGVL